MFWNIGKRSASLHTSAQYVKMKCLARVQKNTQGRYCAWVYGEEVELIARSESMDLAVKAIKLRLGLDL